MTLSDIFAYYDRLVDGWLNQISDIDRPFLPEPWWGWTPDCGAPLRAVVINLNPGKGGERQSRKCVRCRLGDNFSYRRAMTDRLLARHLPETAAWHKNKRETPLLRASGIENPDSDTFSANTLCVEIYPHHSDSFDDREARTYLCANGGERLWMALRLAAMAAKSAGLPYVVVRMSAARWERLLEGVAKCQEPYRKEAVADKKPKKEIYVFDDVDGLKDIGFYCIWQPGRRNNLPSVESLRELLAEGDNSSAPRHIMVKKNI